MSRIIPTGEQNFATLREENLFYIDKTRFIQEWWEGRDRVTLITRPRRFGKTLMLDTITTFFSPEFNGRKDLFEDLEIWKNEKIRELQGKVPVIFISFSGTDCNNYDGMKRAFKNILSNLYNSFRTILDFNLLYETEKEQFASVRRDMSDETAQMAIQDLSIYLARQFGELPLVLLDEYDAPLQAAWLHGYWDEAVDFLRGLFNLTFKTNKSLGRGLMTGITRVSKESLFSGLNNLKVVTITSKLYTTSFGFTEDEVFAIMDEYNLKDKEEVKRWYDGFIFGGVEDIYNPWSIIGYLSEQSFEPYWAQTSSNALVGQLIANSSVKIKEETEDLLQGKSITVNFDEQVIFSQLYKKPGAIWSLLMAAGYVKPLRFDRGRGEYEITLTNYEVKMLIDTMISEWFNNDNADGEKFRKALLSNDIEIMNVIMSDIAENTFSFFDAGKKEPERFYHAFVLGLIVDFRGRYEIVSNRETGLGRCDVMLIPLHSGDRGIIIEFKTRDVVKEKTLKATCNNALKQIRKMRYASTLQARGVVKNAIFSYGFGFDGKQVLIAGGASKASA
ncbi:MAG: ATP-binding protein [Desulfovibrio sp.]|jgi:hypothetical protein|nr:ATP-binding protein [Desulfovibrio sp.]